MTCDPQNPHCAGECVQNLGSEIPGNGELSDRLSVAIEHLAEAIIITDACGAIQYINPAFTRITGYEREEVMGQNPRILKSGEHPDGFYQAMWDTLMRGETWSGRLKNRKRDGTIILEEAKISPVRGEDGRTTHYVAVKRDVSPEAALEQKLRESQKLEAIGTLAGGIAHDFNNILYALLGYAQLALDEMPEESNARTYLEEINKAGERASELVAKMMTFGQRSHAAQREIRIQDVIGEALHLARASLPATIEFQIDLDENCPLVVADPTQIHQVILNLCTNAEFAMRDRSGKLAVSLEAVDVDLAEARRWPQLTPGKWARIRVADTGIGIEKATAERVFEPYFTTKKSNEGTGLGLAIVHGIVSNHGGSISVESEVGTGTTFSIFLPLSGHVAWPKPVNPPSTVVRSNARILLIDDEEMIVDVAVRGLSRLGFEVTGLTDGVAAVEVFREDPYAFDAVVTDQTMPGITGFEVAAKVMEIRPDLPVILTTGYCDKDGERKVMEAGFRRLLPKPLKINDLAETLEELTSQLVSNRG